MKECVKISVIIPVYNGEKFIKRCLKSVLRQSYSNYEVIIINDGSSDDSVRIINEFIQKLDKQEQYTLIDKNNEGVAKTRNYGISLARGEYITFIDQDDYINPLYFESYINMLDKGNDIIIGGYKRVSTKKVMKTVCLTSGMWSPFVCVAPWAHFYRADFLKNNNIVFLDSPIGEDIYFNLIAYSYAKSIKVIQDTNYNWFYNGASVSNSKQKQISVIHSPMYLLSRLHTDFPEKNRIRLKTREYFFLRYIIWFLLFTARGSKRTEIAKVYDDLFAWLNKQYPDYKSNSYIWRKPRGELFSIHLAVMGFMLLRGIRLDKKFLMLLAKG